MFDPLIWARALHFAATIAVTGAIFFLGFVAEPAFRAARTGGGLLAGTRRQLAAISWVGLALALISGVAWLLLLSAQMVDLPLAQAWSEGAPATVLSETDFGQAWTIRLVLAGLLAASLPWLATSNPVLSWQRAAVASLLAAALVGTLAWGGHAAAGTGIQGGVHLVADILHLIAAAWLGALVPLALLLRAATADADQANLKVASAAVLRFSTLGVVSVGTLVGSGLVNTWVLAGSVPALVGTDYGRLLLIKIALFFIMLLFATVNRFRLTPQLTASSDIDLVKGALRRLKRNALIEVVLGGMIIVVVSVLGTMPSGLEALN